jgi:two-component sensor histidine kinase
MPRRRKVEDLNRANDQLDRRLHYDALFETMSEGFAVCEAIWDADGRLVDYVILEMNPALQRMLRVGPEAIGTKLSDSEGDRRAWLELCDRVLKTGRAEAFESHNRRSASWHEIHVSRVTETRMAQFFFDITARKLAEIRQAELFDELNHRVKNNLTLVSGLLQMQARGALNATVREQLTKAADRVHSIAQVHAALYRGASSHDVDFGGYLQDLCAGLSKSLFSDDRIAIEVAAETVSLAVDTALPLGMVVNELVTNAVKYAYPEPERGVIRVRFVRENEGLLLSVSDKGPGLPQKAEKPNGALGMKLVTSLVAQVQGELRVRPRPGATFEIRLAGAPISDPE